MLLITKELVEQFRTHLRAEERAAGTLEKYIRDIRAFAAWLDRREASRETAAAWKEALLEQGYAPVTVNSMLAAVNALFRFVGVDCRVRYLRIQRRLFRDQSRELTRDEYERLIATARERGNERLALLLETVGSTGIRVSEVKYITIKAIQNGRTEVFLKGKIRTILLPSRLCRKLQKYAKKQHIVSGEIFLTRNGTSLSRKQIWADMKKLCRAADVAESKVFPHNLRHLFARVFYKASRDVAKLADVLGHSSIETTRIYLISTGVEHVRQLERMWR